MAAVRKLQTNVNYDKINSSSEFQLQACEAVRAALSPGPDTNIPVLDWATALEKREWVELVTGEDGDWIACLQIYCKG